LIGKHACPGRFFAGNELKSMLVYLILNYDFKTVDGVRPANMTIGSTIMPNLMASLEFRKRQL
jgi:cytochrome P450